MDGQLRATAERGSLCFDFAAWTLTLEPQLAVVIPTMSD